MMNMLMPIKKTKIDENNIIEEYLTDEEYNTQDSIPIEELKTYDLFITKINESNIIQEYSAYEEKYNMDIPCIAHIKIECEELGDYANNYKLVDGEMIEITEEEKPIIEIEPTTEDKISILEEEVSGLEIMSAGLLLESAEQQIRNAEQESKDLEQEVTNANLLLEIAMLKGGMV